MALARLVAELNRSETIYPGTDLRLVCERPVEPEPPAPAPPLPLAGGSPSAPGTEPPARLSRPGTPLSDRVSRSKPATSQVCRCPEVWSRAFFALCGPFPARLGDAPVRDLGQLRELGPGPPSA